MATLHNTVVSGNSANDGGAFYIFGNSVKLRIGENSELSNNSATAAAGGIYAFSAATVVISHSTIRNNSAYLGGGFYLFGNANTTVKSSTIELNTAEYAGGAFYTFMPDTPLLVYNCSVVNNVVLSGSGGKKPFIIKYCFYNLFNFYYIALPNFINP